MTMLFLDDDSIKLYNELYEWTEENAHRSPVIGKETMPENENKILWECSIRTIEFESYEIIVGISETPSEAVKKCYEKWQDKRKDGTLQFYEMDHN